MFFFSFDVRTHINVNMHHKHLHAYFIERNKINSEKLGRNLSTIGPKTEWNIERMRARAQQASNIRKTIATIHCVEQLAHTREILMAHADADTDTDCCSLPDWYESTSHFSSENL